jgi:hypothetical protein
MGKLFAKNHHSKAFNPNEIYCPDSPGSFLEFFFPKFTLYKS